LQLIRTRRLRFLAPLALSAALAACGGSSTSPAAPRTTDEGGEGGERAAPDDGAAGKSATEGGAGTTAGSDHAGAGSPSGAAASSVGGASEGDAAGNSGAGGSSGSPSGGPVVLCDPAVTSTNPCASAADVCATPNADTCCLCTDFEQPACDLQWVCATPANNADNCPGAAPNLGAACGSSGLTCSYCTTSGPLFVRCGRQSAGADPTWAKTPGGTCST